MGFGQIATWGPGMEDTIAEKKEVVFRPSTATDTIRVGDQVCYNSDIVGDYKEATSNPSSLGATYAEGAQTYTGRLLIVEKPATGNLDAYAGTVVQLGPLAGADGDRIQIAVPKDGAVVAVMTDQSVTLNSSILCVANGKYEASVAGKPIGVALETVDRSGTDGLVWMRYNSNLGIKQDNGGTAVAAGASAMVANTINWNFAHVAGYSAALLVKAEQSGALASAGGTYAGLFYLNVSGSITASGYTRCLLAQLNLAGTINHAGSHQYALMAQLTGTPTFTANQRCACLSLDCNLGAKPTSGVYNAILIANNGANQTQVDHAIEIFGNYGINFLFSFQSCDGLSGNFISNLGTGANKVITTGTAGTTYKVKVNYGGNDAYMILYSDPTEAAN